MNNNNDNKEGLNAISLGNVEANNLNVPLQDIPPVKPVEPVEPETVETLDMTTNIPNVPPVAPIENQNPTPVPVPPISYDIPQPINSFTTPVFNDIGTVPPIPNGPVPPIPEDKPQKKKMNKTIFVLLIMVALAAVGVGVYIFLHIASVKNVPVRTKLVEIEIESEVSTDINDYATFNKQNSETCSLDTSAITDTSKLNAEYTFKIVCGTSTYTGKAKIVDTEKPEVVAKNITVAKDSSVSPEDFISSCTDKTDCNYSFKEEDKVKEWVKSEGDYRVVILVKDGADNQVEVTATLTVTGKTADVYLVCEQDTYTTKFAINNSVFMKVATRVYEFKFSSSTEYNNFKEEFKDKNEVTYNNITGTPEYNDNTLTLKITKNLSYDELNKEENTTLPLEVGSLRAYYENKLGKDCKLGF